MACGDDGGSNTPDAAPLPDAGRTCTAVTAGTDLVISGGSDDMVLIWNGPVAGDLGTGGDVDVSIQFYKGIGTPLTQPQNLGTGVNANFETCGTCIRVDALNAAGDESVKTFFQDGGTLTLTEDPFNNQKLIGMVSDLTLVEVTLDPETFKSTLVPGGVCLSLGSFMVNADAIPAGWTCPDAAYDDGTTCNCACGASDPDCDIAMAPVAGCTGTQICSPQDTCIDVCNVLSTPPVGCPTGACGFAGAMQDICYTAPTAVDPAVLGGTCASGTPRLCAVVNTVGTGMCDNFENDNRVCREACDAATDCNNAGEVCAPVIGMASPKGICVTPPINDTCGTATVLTIGTPVNGRTGGAAGDYNMGLEGAACTGLAQPGGDVAYTVVLTANQTITATLSNVSPTFDPSIAILGPGLAAAVCTTATPVTCLKGADAGEDAAGETFTFTATTAGTYFIIVDTFRRIRGGSFTLNVTSP